MSLLRPNLQRRRFSAAFAVIHWLIALLIAISLVLGWAYGSAHGLAQFQLVQWHKSVGLSVLVLTALRIAMRISTGEPPYLRPLTHFERIASLIVHVALYATCLLIPLTGWIMVSASPMNIPTLVFEWVPWPFIAPIHRLNMAVRRAVEHQATLGHEVLVWLMLFLLALHIVAAVKHQFFDRDQLMGRINPLARN